LKVLSSREGPSEQHQQRVSFMNEQGFYEIAKSSFADAAASSCLTELLEDAEWGLPNSHQQDIEC
jgi:hypothetical protein